MIISKKVTKIETQKKRRNRYSIFLDGEFAFGLDQEVVYKTGVKEGDCLSDADIHNLLLLEERKTAKDSALRLLAHRDRSEKEIQDKLKQLNYLKETIDWVLSELKQMKLLDDAQFAHTFVKTKMINKPMGEYLLRRELQQKGIGEESIALAIEAAFQDRDQVTIAKELAEKQLQKYRNLDEKKIKKRLFDFLMRRGFSWDIIQEIVAGMET